MFYGRYVTNNEENTPYAHLRIFHTFLIPNS